MATTDISEYTSAILSQKKGETVRDAIINAVKVISGAVSGSRSASTLNGEPLTNFVVNYYDPNSDKPFAVSLNQTKANMKREVDKINYGDPSLAKQTELGPYSKTGLNNNHSGTHSLDRLEVTRRDIYEAINEAWRNTPSGAHGSDEYLVLDSDPFEDYPYYISLIGSGEGYALRCSERTEPIIENGTYTAEEGTGWTKVTVNVSDKNIGPHTATITADGMYEASSYGKDGFSFVNVQVPVVSPDDPTYVPEAPYNPTAWYSGGTVNEKWPVFFYLDYEGGKLLDKQYVEDGEDAIFNGDWNEVKKAGYYFTGWDPEPTNITSRTICVAKWKRWKQVSQSSGEISDSWATIAQNHGTAYNVGDWKILDFGTVLMPVDYYDYDAEEIVSSFVKFKIGKKMVAKMGGADADKGINSTWGTIDLVKSIQDKKRIYTPSMFWLMSSMHKFTSYGEDEEFSIGFSDTDLYNFLNGKTNTGGSTANNIYMNLPSTLLANIKTIDLETHGYTAKKVSSNIVVQESYTEKASCRFWIPTLNEIRYATDGNYGKFFYSGMSSSYPNYWMNKTSIRYGNTYNYGFEYKSPVLSSSMPVRHPQYTTTSRSFLRVLHHSPVADTVIMNLDESGNPIKGKLCGDTYMAFESSGTAVGTPSSVPVSSWGGLSSSYPATSITSDTSRYIRYIVDPSNFTSAYGYHLCFCL